MRSSPLGSRGFLIQFNECSRGWHGANRLTPRGSETTIGAPETTEDVLDFGFARDKPGWLGRGERNDGMRHREPRLSGRFSGWELAFGLSTIIGLALGAHAPSVLAQVPVVDQEAPATSSASTYVSPAETRLRADVTFLAHDDQEGRAPGTKGIEVSAEYIAKRFEELGLKPAPGADGYFQPFSISGRPQLGEPIELVAQVGDGEALKAEPKTDFSPLALGASGKVESAPVVFAGYGITAEKLGYDDYAGRDVTGKAVLVLRREPRQDDEQSPFDGKRDSAYATFRHKATNAFQHGAAMLLIVNDLAGSGKDVDTLLSVNQAGFDTISNLPIVHLSRDFADKILQAAGAPSLADLEAQIDEDLKPRTQELKGASVSTQITIDRPAIETRNVIGVLEGEGPLADETIVVGGHYDHLGRGGLMSGSLAFLSNEIHNGADDNASGTAMVLEIARRFAERRDPPARRIVFMAFSGEERGLLGSRHYVENPLYPLNSTVLMVNFDMVGRLNDKSELTMIGTGSTPGAEELVKGLGEWAGLSIKTVKGMTDGFGGSDHQPFHGKEIPILFAFTGLHSDYHRPSDDSDKINYAGMVRIADYMESILLDTLGRPDRPVFAKAPAETPKPAEAPKVAAETPKPAQAENAPSESASSSINMSVSLGVMPDYADETKTGMKISDVRAGGPADKGGLKGGDTIIGIGGKPIGTIYDYMESLTGYKPGEKVEVVVQRDGKEVKLNVELGAAARSATHE